MQTVLVTGGAGFIGSHTCKALAAAGLLPVAFDDLSTGHAGFARFGPLAQGDILDAPALDGAFAAHRPGAVIHFAARAYVGESMKAPLAYYRVNVAGLVNVVEAMLRHGTRAIVFSSSCATYGIPDALPIAESAPQRPINPYGRSKLAGEQILADARAAHGLRVAVLRYFNAAGAHPDGDLPERHDPETHLIPLAIDAATGHGAPLSYYRVNVEGLVSVVEAMLRHGVRTIVFSSSCATYGIPDALPIAEDAPQRPINPYGRSKLAGEQILADARAAQGLRVAVLRYFNAAGADPDGDLPERHDPETHLIPLAIDAATGRGAPLSIFGTDYPTADGTCERDYIHVSDLAAAHVEALRRLDTGTAALTLNLGTGKAASVRSVIAAVERITGRAVPLVHAARREGDPPVLVADASLACEVVGFAPRLSNLDTIVTTAWRARAHDTRDRKRA